MPMPDAEIPAPASEPWTELESSARAAEGALRAWLERLGPQPEGANAIRDLNYAITALRRLIDIRRLLVNQAQGESAPDDGSDPATFQQQVRQTLERLAADGAEGGAEDSLPD